VKVTYEFIYSSANKSATVCLLCNIYFNFATVFTLFTVVEMLLYLDGSEVVRTTTEFYEIVVIIY